VVYTHFLLYYIGCMAERLKSKILEQEKMVDHYTSSLVAIELLSISWIFIVLAH
jgi:hypothetical protein